MVDARAEVEFRIVLEKGSNVFHDQKYLLDFDNPDWEPFDLTPSERRRCEELFSAAVEMWKQRETRRLQAGEPPQDDDFPEPVSALVDATVSVIGEAIKRTVESRWSQRPLAVAV